MSKRDYYEVLGLAKNATDDDIKKAYRKLASKYHPDKLAESEKQDGEAKFKEAKEAYETLSDPTKKAQYDQYGHTTESGNNPFRHGRTHTYYSADDLDDLHRVFEDMFGNGRFSEHFQNSRNRANTQQTIYLVNISLADAYMGRTLKVDGSSIINIPKGARSGAKFYVDGKIYKINVEPHHKFKRANDDLLLDMTITAIEAILGVEVTFEHLDGTKLQFNIPNGIQPGQVIKLGGKGMKNPETDRYGDLLIRIAITIPKTISQEERQALKGVAHRESINI